MPFTSTLLPSSLPFPQSVVASMPHPPAHNPRSPVRPTNRPGAGWQPGWQVQTNSSFQQGKTCMHGCSIRRFPRAVLLKRHRRQGASLEMRSGGLTHSMETLGRRGRLLRSPFRSLNAALAGAGPRTVIESTQTATCHTQLEHESPYLLCAPQPLRLRRLVILSLRLAVPLPFNSLPTATYTYFLIRLT